MIKSVTSDSLYCCRQSHIAKEKIPGLYPGILGMGFFPEIGPSENENSRVQLQNLGILYDFKEFSMRMGPLFCPLRIS